MVILAVKKSNIDPTPEQYLEWSYYWFLKSLRGLELHNDPSMATDDVTLS